MAFSKTKLFVLTSLLTVSCVNAQEEHSSWKSYLPQKAQDFLDKNSKAQGSGAESNVKREMPLFSYAPIVKKTSPAVVSVSAIQKAQTQAVNPFLDDPFFRFFFDSPMLGVPRQELSKSLGSAVLIDPSGYLITCYHVISHAEEIKVQLEDDTTYEAQVVLKDPKSDLAVLKITNPDRKNFPFVPLCKTNDQEVGDVVLAIGYPFGINHTVTTGILSALDTKIDSRRLLQTDAPINPGNSGGGLFNTRGELVGIANAILSKSGASHGVGFAIPVAIIKPLIEAALQGKKIARPWIGLNCQSLTPEMASSLGLGQLKGAIISSVQDLSPLKKVLQDGDVIVSINQQSITSNEDIDYYLSTHKVGDVLVFEVVQNGKKESFNVTLQEQPTLSEDEVLSITTPAFLKGIKLAPLSEKTAATLNLKQKSLTGVVVVEVDEHSDVSGFGLQKGDVFVKINDKKVQTLEDAKAALSLSQQGVSLLINRNGQQMSLRVQF